MTRIIISSSGLDTPGIVGAFTKVLYEHNCNIEDSSMTIISNLFSMILIVSYPETLDLESLKKSFKQVETRFGLCTNIKVLAAIDVKQPDYSAYTPYMLTVAGYDQVGISYHMTSILAKYNINITDFNSKLVNKSGKKAYIMMVETMVPPGVMKKAVQDLKLKADEMSVDITFREIEQFEQL